MYKTTSDHQKLKTKVEIITSIGRQVNSNILEVNQETFFTLYLLFYPLGSLDSIAYLEFYTDNLLLILPLHKNKIPAFISGIPNNSKLWNAFGVIYYCRFEAEEKLLGWQIMVRILI